MEKSTWETYIHSDPNVLLGKPVVKGTRLSVDFILGLFAEGWNEADVIKNYPSLSHEAIQAVFAFASECMQEEFMFSIPHKSTT